MIYPFSSENLAPRFNVLKCRPFMRTAARAGLITAVILLFANVDFAITLREYHERVKSAILSLDLIHSAEEHQQANNDAFIQANLRGAREALPQKEIVEWRGTKFVIDNSWLDDQLKEFERSEASSSDRSAALERSLERLQALEVRLAEIDKASTMSLPSKAEMRDRLASILQRSEYVRAPKEESALLRIIKRLLKWLNSFLPANRTISPERATAVSRFAQVFVIALALAAIGYVLWTFGPRFMNRRKNKKRVKAKVRVVLGERLEPEKSASDLLAEAEALARSGDLRGAIRRGYIALLVELADRKLISLAQYKTNRDYLRSIREIKDLHRNVEILTNNFEQHWYGLVPADENTWAAFRSGYKEAITSA